MSIASTDKGRVPVSSLIRFGILAPSSHNSQPWLMTSDEKSISVFANNRRRLPVSDVNDRQLLISIGCAITNIVVAADYHGYVAEIAYFPDSADESLVAKLNFTPEHNVRDDKKHLIYSIEKRVTNRNTYENRLPDSAFLSEVQSLATSDIHVDLVQEKEHRNAVADIALASASEAMSDDRFRRELSGYMKSNITRSSIGMPGYGFGFPLLVSLVAPIALQFFNMGRLSRKQDEALLKMFTPLFVIISTKDDDRISWIKAGQLYERIALIATRFGISTAIWAAPIQISDHYKKLQNILGSDFRPQVFFRAGYTDAVVRHSPRLTQAEQANILM